MGFTFFYCVYRRPETQEVQQIVASLTSQLSQTSQTITQSLVNQFKARQTASSMHRRLLLDADTLLQIIRNSFSDLDKIILVIDALDECRETPLVVHKLRKLYEETNQPLKILVRSRAEREIADELRHLPQISLTDHTRNDIEIYVQAQVEQRRKVEPDWCSKEIEEQVVRKIPKVAGNM